MTGPELLRSRSIMSEFSRQGAKVVSITAKDRMPEAVAKGDGLFQEGQSAFPRSTQINVPWRKTESKVLEFVGQPLPDMYSAQLSLLFLMQPQTA